jgi:ubiquinone/menaquinone biosynthesis C-methylase UbiE
MPPGGSTKHNWRERCLSDSQNLEKGNLIEAIRTRLRGLFNRLNLKKSVPPGSGLNYWEQRHKKYGVRSILNLGHTEEEVDAVTRMQKAKLFPLLAKQLNGHEKMILDFGCGPGRFTADLAEMIQGRAVGVDPSEYLLSLTPENSHVEYRRMEEGVIPLEDASADVVWICLVLSIIIDEQVLRQTLGEFDRVLKADGLLFLVANTAEREDMAHIKFRSVSEYQEAFANVDLRLISEYDDLGERISIMAGRRRGPVN